MIKSTEEDKRSAASGDSEDGGEKTEQSNDSLQFLVIKEEPIEWTEVNEAEMELVDEKEVFSTEMTIKPEIYMEDSEEQGLYSPLTCELCTETFTLPAEWVRHVQTHTDMLPAKRQRRGKNQQVGRVFGGMHGDVLVELIATLTIRVTLVLKTRPF